MKGVYCFENTRNLQSGEFHFSNGDFLAKKKMEMRDLEDFFYKRNTSRRNSCDASFSSFYTPASIFSHYFYRLMNSHELSKKEAARFLVKWVRSYLMGRQFNYILGQGQIASAFLLSIYDLAYSMESYSKGIPKKEVKLSPEVCSFSKEIYPVLFDQTGSDCAFVVEDEEVKEVEKQKTFQLMEISALLPKI